MKKSRVKSQEVREMNSFRRLADGSQGCLVDATPTAKDWIFAPTSSVFPLFAVRNTI